jgi:hypothetical protein
VDEHELSDAEIRKRIAEEEGRYVDLRGLAYRIETKAHKHRRERDRLQKILDGRVNHAGRAEGREEE